MWHLSVARFSGWLLSVLIHMFGLINPHLLYFLQCNVFCGLKKIIIIISVRKLKGGRYVIGI